MKFGLIRSDSDMKALTNEQVDPQKRFDSLTRITEETEHGFMYLFMCLVATSSMAQHEVAVQELNREGESWEWVMSKFLDS